MDLAQPGARTPADTTQVVARAGHIFISYARSDARRANDVEHMLAGWGFATWMDRQRLGGGENWSRELERAIDASAAAVLMASPAALASPMVWQEYLRALAHGIPLTLVTWDHSATLPPELAHAPLVDMRARLRATPALYFALVDRGAAPEPMAGELAQRSVAATAPAQLTVAAGRAPADWQVVRAPMWSYWLRLAGRIAPALCYLLALNLIPSAWWRTLNGEQVGYWLMNTLAPPLILVALLFALPGVTYVFILTRRVDREMVILAPASCVVSMLSVSRFTALATPCRYLYRWASAARIERGALGSLRVTFTGRDGALAAFRLPWYWPNRVAIGQRVGADVATSAPSASPEPPSASTPDAVATTVHPIAYGLLAPKRDGALVTTLQTWLRSRGLAPVEMVWTNGREGVLAPTARGAAACRVVIFTDDSAITHDARWRAVLADLRQRGVTLIPLRTGSRLPAASEWSALQWVDFSQGIARQRSFLNLCDTLDRNGLLPTVMAPSLDTELALARATYQRLPPGWRSFAGELALQSTRARLRNNWALKVTLLVGLVVIVAVALAGYLVIAGITIALGVSSAALSAVVGVLALCLTIALFVGAVVYQIVARFRSHADLLRERTIQERLVITPDSLVYHLLTGRSSRFARRMLVGGYAPEEPNLDVAQGCLSFAWIATIEGCWTWSGTRAMRIGLRDGAVITLPLLSLGATAELALESAREALRRWRERQATTGAASPVANT